MKLLNKKGFVLVETLIVTVFVMTLFTVVYQTVIPYMGEYEKMSSYDDIDSIYASNLLKQMITRYANTKYIDEYLENNTYIQMNDCSNKNLYINSNYCTKLQENLGISDSDYVFITDYDITDFRKEVKKDEYFDSGNLSNFRSYIDTVSDTEGFYENNTDTETIGKYRLFITRTVTEADQSTTLKYVNIGIYTGGYQKYLMGEEIKFDPGDGEKTFYVLKNSSSRDKDVTLILSSNLENSNVSFNSSNSTFDSPDTLLNKLKTLTNGWVNVEPLVDEFYVSLDGYMISYDGYRARLINEVDIKGALGCSNNDFSCFNYMEAFPYEFDVKWLNSSNSYWTSTTVPYSGAYVWSVQNGKLVPVLLNEDAKFEIRPVITISKDKLK